MWAVALSIKLKAILREVLMHLKRYTDLSLRVLLFLGASSSDEAVTVPHLVEKLDCSYNHLNKVMAFLRQQGWVRALRGRKGGFQLQPAALTLGVGEIIKTIEGECALIDCGKPHCPFKEKGCPLVPSLVKAQRAFFDSLNEKTLSELLSESDLMH